MYGDLKGTPRAPIEEHLAAGDDVLIEVDIHGARAVREQFPDVFVVFVRPPSRAVQRDRLQARDPTASPAAIERRLDEADTEEAAAGDFDATVVNDDLDAAVEEMARLLEERRRVR